MIHSKDDITDFHTTDMRRVPSQQSDHHHLALVGDIETDAYTHQVLVCLLLTLHVLVVLLDQTAWPPYHSLFLCIQNGTRVW